MFVPWAVASAGPVIRVDRDEAPDLPFIQNELAATVRQAFEPVHVTVWLPDREPDPAERPLRGR
jgi:hypothetical protein